MLRTPRESPPRILAVEDDRLSAQALQEILETAQFDVVVAGNGAEAWQYLTRDPQAFDLILLDRMMPDMDGIQVLRRLRREHPEDDRPVIMQTALTADEDIAEGLRAGAYYYLTKPFAAVTLLAVVYAALGDLELRRSLRERLAEMARTLHTLQSARFTFREPDQAREIASLVASAGPRPERVALGLTELMFNAIEHGNLGITYAEKSRLIADGSLAREIARRLATPDLGARSAVLEFERTDTELRYLIRDQGRGFDWNAYMDFSPARAFHTHGRGIAMSRALSFDRMEFRAPGNEVVVAVNA